VTLEDRNSPLLEREALFWWVMAELILRHSDDPPPLQEAKPERNCVKKVRDYIESHYADNLSLNQLASLVNYTPYHIIRLFNRSVGLPPHAYLTLVRIREAKQLLANGFSIADAACQTGFVDQSHLTKHFKRVFGITPGQYVQSFALS
jgi:AraC-like DNA-binding protein